MTEQEFHDLYELKPEQNRSIAADTVRRVNNSVFAQVADLPAGAAETDVAVKDAFTAAIQDL